MWGPFTPGRHNFGESNLRQTTWLHRRYDVDYNGWWMSLIPVSVLKEVGLSLPVFIKWDDAEYSLRARKHGVPTVSLPGAAVWHVSWVDKDDSHDWQAYFHARNRLITALLHSPEPRGGKLWRTYLAADLKNLLTMDYYTVAMHLTAVRSIFAGPQRLHQELPGRLKKIRAMASGFRESKLLSSVEDLPHFPAREIMAVTTGRSDPGPRGLRFAWWLAKQIVRHGFTEPSDDALQKPQAHLAFQDARWFEVPNYESVLISNASGSGATWHVRNPRVFRRMLWQSVMLHWRVHREWNRLRAKYIKALPNITSVEEWAKTLEVNPSAVKAARKQR